LSIAGGGGKRDVVELTVWGYANDDDAAKAACEVLAKIIRAN
jgi:hypothetical protein